MSSRGPEILLARSGDRPERREILLARSGCRPERRLGQETGANGLAQSGDRLERLGDWPDQFGHRTEDRRIGDMEIEVKSLI